MRILTTCLFLLLLFPTQAQMSPKDGIELRKLLLANVNELRDREIKQMYCETCPN